MSNDEILTDDYVAGLLSQEANDCSLKYSTMGMEAFQSTKKPSNMLKPNTRFLRHIIKDTDTHNKALLAKEAAESRARLKDLERAEEVKRMKTNPTTRDIRRRQMGDIHAILGGKRRKKDDEEEAGESSSRKSRDHESKSRGLKIRGRAHKDEEGRDLFRDHHDDKKQHGRLSREDRHSERTDRSRRGDRRRSRSRSRDRSDDESRRHHRRSRRDRSQSPRSRRRSRSPRERRHRHRHRSPLEEPKSSPKRRDAEVSDQESDDDMGPAPPPRYRGRGTVGGSSGIDRRFSESYDPKTDVQMDDDEAGGSNWDDAVEAFRDRQKLRQNQEQRLRAAGFTDDLIQRVNSTKEKAEEDVKWSKAGEKREWDKGKEVSLDSLLSEDEL